MLDSQIQTICHIFDCDPLSVDRAEEKVDRLVVKKGVEDSLKFLDELLEKLSNKERWSGYDRVALIRSVLKQNYFL